MLAGTIQHVLVYCSDVLFVRFTYCVRVNGKRCLKPNPDPNKRYDNFQEGGGRAASAVIIVGTWQFADFEISL